MSVFGDNKLVLCAGVAGVLGAGVLGFVLGKRSGTPMSARQYFTPKSFEEQANPVLNYVMEHSLREPELLRKLKEVV
jgi:hypothetical protein